MFKSFVDHPKNTKYLGEDLDEEIYYVLRSSLITLVPWVILIAALMVAPFYIFPFFPKFIDETFRFVLFIFWYLVVFGMSFQKLLNWFFNVYIITNKKIVDVDFYGIFYKRISEAPLSNVEDVTSTVNGFWGVMFNIGDVFIQTAAEKTEFEFSSIDNPAKVRDIISDLVATKRKGNH